MKKRIDETINKREEKKSNNDVFKQNERKVEQRNQNTNRNTEVKRNETVTKTETNQNTRTSEMDKRNKSR